MQIRIVLLLGFFLSFQAIAGLDDDGFEGGRGYTCEVSDECSSKLAKVYRDGAAACVGFNDDGSFMACEGTPQAARARQAKARAGDNNLFGTQSMSVAPGVATGDQRPAGNNPDESDETHSAASEGEHTVVDGCEIFDAGIQSCNAEHDSAISRCDDKNDPDMASAGRTATMTANAVSTATAASMQMACSKMKDVSMTMQAALTGFKAACESARSSCVSECGAVVNDINNYPQCAGRKATVSKQLADCKKLDNQMAQINYGLQSMMATHLNAKQCDSMSVADSVDFCKSNPTSPICKTDNVNCNDPKMSATNPVCICMNNPHDPVCGGGGNRGSTSNSYGVNGSGGSGVNGKLGGSASAASLGGLLGGKNGAGNGFGDGGAGSPVDGKGTNPVEAGNGSGGGRGLAGGGGGNSLGGGSDSGSSGFRGNKNAGGGFYGGGGAMPSGGGNYAGGSGGGGGLYGSNPKYQGQPGKPNEQVDLRQFLPKSRPNMMLGMTGPDGITGPTSDIWTKINHRYMSIRPSMRP